MAIASFYAKGNKNFELAYFDHNTGNADKSVPIINKFAKDNDIIFHVGKLNLPKPSNMSLEEFWRIERYSFLNSFELPIVTCHHLNDAIETWLFTAMHGNPKLIPVTNKNVIRPFLTNTKNDLIRWCVNNNIPWNEDESNMDLHHPRNRIRANIIPQALMVNPGLHKVIKKKYL